jgi:hypothetical protein
MSHEAVPSYAFIRATVQGLDAAAVKLHHDEVNGAWFIELDPDGAVGIRIDLKYPETLGRDREGLEQLARAAAQLAREISAQIAEAPGGQS